MFFEFVIAYHQSEASNLARTIVGVLGKVLEDNYDAEPESVGEMIRFRYEREGSDSAPENGDAGRYMIVGFALDLPDDTEQVQGIVEEFAAALAETPAMIHVVKFEDPVLRSQLLRWAEEMFDLEMKLRRVLTFIYLYANQDGDPWELLRDDAAQPIAKEKPTVDQMRAAAENQFFHLTFGQYSDLNRRPQFNLTTLLDIIRDNSSYEYFRTEVDRLPIEHEDDAVLLAGLKERMDAIEKMRNCVAHNRRPSKRIIENYVNARPLLDRILDAYLARWEINARQEFKEEATKETPATQSEN